MSRLAPDHQQIDGNTIPIDRRKPRLEIIANPFAGVLRAPDGVSSSLAQLSVMYVYMLMGLISISLQSP
ncbi:hypothetical protein R69608_05882 [Paraburkholderia nemoris]|nr:hypothetical protein R69608_05882 [Paraburkholderia nemoris]